MAKLKVGDRVRLSKESGNYHQCKGEDGVVIKNEGFVTDDEVHWIRVEWDNEYENSYDLKNLTILKRGRKPKPEGRIAFKVLKNDCNNYESTIKANTAKEATKEFKKEFKKRAGYTLYKPIVTTIEKKRIMIKEIK